MLLTAAVDPPGEHVIAARDGASLRLYEVRPPGTPAGTIYFVQGSGCASLSVYLRTYAKALSERWRVVGLDKQGVARGDLGLFCSRDFDDGYTWSAMLRRHREALAFVTAAHGAPAAIIGVSEGGTMAAQLAAEQPGIGKLVVIGSGGLPFRQSLRILADREGWRDALESMFIRLAANPQSSTDKEWGFPHRYWTSMLDIEPTPLFLAFRKPIPLIIGEKDERVPLESALSLRHRFTAAGRTDLSLRIVPGAGHALTRAGHDLKEAVLRETGDWLSQ
jgi:pimeloyl-ACP methyl ester carboxylesterase